MNSFHKNPLTQKDWKTRITYEWCPSSLASGPKNSSHKGVFSFETTQWFFHHFLSTCLFQDQSYKEGYIIEDDITDMAEVIVAILVY